MMIKQYEKELNRLNHLKDQYDLQKHNLQVAQLTLKYGEEYQQYKTIKEKEERMILDTVPLSTQLLATKSQLRQARAKVEILRLQIDMEVKKHDD